MASYHAREERTQPEATRLQAFDSKASAKKKTIETRVVTAQTHALEHRGFKNMST